MKLVEEIASITPTDSWNAAIFFCGTILDDEFMYIFVCMVYKFGASYDLALISEDIFRPSHLLIPSFVKPMWEATHVGVVKSLA